MNMLDFKRGSQLRLDLVAAVLKLKYFFLKANKKNMKKLFGAKCNVLVH